MGGHWADQHLAAKPTGVTYRDPKPPKRGGGGVVALVVVLALGCLGAGGWWAWQAGLFAEAEPVIDEPAAVAALPDIPELAPVMAPEPEPEAAPDLPGHSTQEQDRILRGIDLLERQRKEHQAEATRYADILDAAQNKRAYPVGQPRYTFEQWITAEIAKAKAAKASTVSLDRQLVEYRAKVGEYKTKLHHEREVIESLDKRIAAEQAKLSQ